MKLFASMKQVLLSGALVAALASPVAATESQTAALTDISASYAKTEINALVEAGILTGYSDGSFKPSQKMTRQEFAKVLVKAMGLPENAAAAAHFTDVQEWARPYVGALVEAGITQGVTPTEFGAGHPVTREQLAVFFVRAMGAEELSKELALYGSFGDETKIMGYAKPYVAMMQKIGFIKGSANANGGFDFNPQGNADRQAVARLAYEFYQDGESYKGKVASMEEIYRLLNSANEAAAASTSLQYETQVDSPEAAEQGMGHMIIQFTKDPRAMLIHTKIAITEEQLVPVDMYVQADAVYMLIEGEWVKTGLPPEFELLMSGKSVDEIAFPNVIAPFLTLAEDELTYTLTGTVPFAEFGASLETLAFSGVSVEQAEEIKYELVIEKETRLPQSFRIQVKENGQYLEAVGVSYSLYNAVEPIVLPEEAKDAVDISGL